MAMRKLATLGFATMLASCTAADDNRLQFCDSAGRVIDDVFLNLLTAEMVLDDVVLHGTLDWGQADLCFDPRARVFRFRPTQDPTAAREIEVPVKWGSHNWMLSPTTKRIKFQGGDWVAVSCKPIRMQPFIES